MSSIYVGTGKLKKIYFPDVKVKKIYIGTEAVWSSWEDPVVTGTDISVTQVYNAQQTGAKLDLE